jgi:hypothetical protein
MDIRVAVQEYGTGESGTVAIDTGIAKLHTEISQFGQSADKDFNANGQNFGYMCGIRLSSCISNIDSKSFMLIVEALIRGETDPETLVGLVYGNCKSKNRASSKNL